MLAGSSGSVAGAAGFSGQCRRGRRLSGLVACGDAAAIGIQPVVARCGGFFPLSADPLAGTLLRVAELIASSDRGLSHESCRKAQRFFVGQVFNLSYSQGQVENLSYDCFLLEFEAMLKFVIGSVLAALLLGTLAVAGVLAAKKGACACSTPCDCCGCCATGACSCDGGACSCDCCDDCTAGCCAASTAAKTGDAASCCTAGKCDAAQATAPVAKAGACCAGDCACSGGGSCACCDCGCCETGVCACEPSKCSCAADCCAGGTCACAA